MGLILNPTSFRVGHFKSWSDAWYMHRMYYPVFLHNVFLIKTLIHYLLFRFIPHKKSRWVYSHSNLYIYQNKIFLSVYIYSGWGSWIWTEYAKELKYQEWTKLWIAESYWLKKHLLDQNKLAVKWFLILASFGIPNYELPFEDLNLTLHKKTLKKIAGLKKKYSTSKKQFIAKEEFQVLKKMLDNIKKYYDRFGSTFLLKYFYKHYYTKTIKFRTIKHKSYFYQYMRTKKKKIKKSEI